MHKFAEVGGNVAEGQQRDTVWLRWCYWGERLLELRWEEAVVYMLGPSHELPTYLAMNGGTKLTVREMNGPRPHRA